MSQDPRSTDVLVKMSTNSSIHQVLEAAFRFSISFSSNKSLMLAVHFLAAVTSSLLHRFSSADASHAASFLCFFFCFPAAQAFTSR